MSGNKVSTEDILNLIRMRGDYAGLVREVEVRKSTAEAARNRGITVTDEEMQAAADAFRQWKGLLSAAGTQEWLDSVGISLEDFEDYLETNILIRKFKESLLLDPQAERFSNSPQMRMVVGDFVYDEWVRSTLAK